MIIKQDFIPLDTPPRPGIRLAKPTSITIHWVGPYPGQDPMNAITWWKKGPDGKGLQASAHFVIRDDIVINCIPTNEVAWHCRSKGNYTSIGIEVVPINKKGVFSEASIESIAEVIKQWPDLILVRHFDWTGKDCPRYYTPVMDLLPERVANDPGGEERWEALKKELRNG